MALDEQSHRLFVNCRVPADLLTFDTETGKVVNKVHVAVIPTTCFMMLNAGGSMLLAVKERSRFFNGRTETRSRR